MKRESGFTLIEILIATTLFALLMSVYYIVFLNAMRLEDYARSQRSFSNVGPAILDEVERDVESLYTNNAKPDAFPFRGTTETLGGEPADRMNFVADRPSIDQENFDGDKGIRSPINEVGYRLARSTNGDSSVRRLFRRESYYVDGTPLEGGDYYDLYDQVVSFQITYAGYQEEQSERASASTLGEHHLQSFDSWDSTERKALPSAVIVQLTIRPPQIGPPPKNPDDAQIREQTIVRIIRPIQADDVAPPPPANGGGTTPSGTGR